MNYLNKLNMNKNSTSFAHVKQNDKFSLQGMFVKCRHHVLLCTKHHVHGGDWAIQMLSMKFREEV